MTAFERFPASALAIVALTALAACSSSDPATERFPEPVVWPERALVESLVPRFHQLARQRIESVAVERALSARLRAEAKRSWGTRIEGGLKYADLLLEEYEATGWTLAFASPQGVTDRGAGVVARLERAGEDALDDRLYHLAEIEAEVDKLASRHVPTPPSFALTGSEAEAAVEWLSRQDEADPARATRALVDAVLGIGGDPLSPRLADLQRAYRAESEVVTTSVIELELRVADAALRFARDMKHFNYRRVSWPELERRGGGKAVVYDRLATTLADLFAATNEAEADAVLVDLRPPFAQYDRLVTALAEYRSMATWPVVAPFDIQDPAHPETARLRARLLAEGYPADDLRAAVEAYQIAHQFAPGKPTPGFWRSLNVPLERRTREIALTMERYRETLYRDELDYVFVNIPDFHAEVYRHGRLEMRFPVVVGNTERVCDAETGKWHYPNATPIQWAPMDHLVLNPWWNVPPRLFKEEIEPRVDDAAWLASKGYEIFGPPTQRQARQRPGTGNALGLVKFIFPNEHNTYMHDTPHKQYFSLPVRAYSHGCVRVHEPLAFAEYLMTEYDLGGKARLDRIIESGSTIRIDLPTPIPVFFEYYTVRIADDGRAQFLADPYGLDADRLAEAPVSCLAPPPTQPAAAAAPPVDETPSAPADDLGP